MIVLDICRLTGIVEWSLWKSWAFCRMIAVKMGAEMSIVEWSLNQHGRMTANKLNLWWFVYLTRMHCHIKKIEALLLKFCNYNFNFKVKRKKLQPRTWKGQMRAGAIAKIKNIYLMHFWSFLLIFHRQNNVLSLCWGYILAQKTGYEKKGRWKNWKI